MSAATTAITDAHAEAKYRKLIETAAQGEPIDEAELRDVLWRMSIDKRQHDATLGVARRRYQASLEVEAGAEARAKLAKLAGEESELRERVASEIAAIKAAAEQRIAEAGQPITEFERRHAERRRTAEAVCQRANVALSTLAGSVAPAEYGDEIDALSRRKGSLQDKAKLLAKQWQKIAKIKHDLDDAERRSYSASVPDRRLAQDKLAGLRHRLKEAESAREEWDEIKTREIEIGEQIRELQDRDRERHRDWRNFEL